MPGQTDVSMDAAKLQANVQIVIHVRNVAVTRLRALIAVPFITLGCLIGGYRGVTFQYKKD